MPFLSFVSRLCSDYCSGGQYQVTVYVTHVGCRRHNGQLVQYSGTVRNTTFLIFTMAMSRTSNTGKPLRIERELQDSLQQLECSANSH